MTELYFTIDTDDKKIDFLQWLIPSTIYEKYISSTHRTIAGVYDPDVVLDILRQIPENKEHVSCDIYSIEYIRSIIKHIERIIRKNDDGNKLRDKVFRVYDDKFSFDGPSIIYKFTSFEIKNNNTTWNIPPGLIAKYSELCHTILSNDSKTTCIDIPDRWPPHIVDQVLNILFEKHEYTAVTFQELYRTVTLLDFLECDIKYIEQILEQNIIEPDSEYTIEWLAKLIEYTERLNTTQWVKNYYKKSDLHIETLHHIYEQIDTDSDTKHNIEGVYKHTMKNKQQWDQFLNDIPYTNK